MLPFGFMPFEQVYRIDEQGLARIRKLGPRLPKTVADVDVASDGGLVSITQYPRSGEPPSSIPVSRLVVYVNDREGGNWIGRSLLRPAYKNWLIKDRLLRVQAQTVERNGMGVPLYKAPPGASDADIATGAAMAQAWRAGQDSGSAIPYDADLVLRGVEGDLPDADKPIRYHDEQIARAVLAHFLNLGTETGSWALGSTFADFFTLSLQTLAQSVADVVTQHIIEDLVDLNWGTAEPAPRLIFDEIGSRQAATATAIKSLIDAGAVTADEVLEGALRQQYGLPPQDKTTSRVAPDGGGLRETPTNQTCRPRPALDLAPLRPERAPGARYCPGRKTDSRPEPGGGVMPPTAARPWYEVHAKADDRTATIRIYDDIGWFGTSAKTFGDELAALDVDAIDVRLNSPGGRRVGRPGHPQRAACPPGDRDGHRRRYGRFGGVAGGDGRRQDPHEPRQPDDGARRLGAVGRQRGGHAQDRRNARQGLRLVRRRLRRPGGWHPRPVARCDA
jgi:hypothetical protein